MTRSWRSSVALLILATSIGITGAAVLPRADLGDADARQAATQLVLRHMNNHNLPADPRARAELVGSSSFMAEIDRRLSETWHTGVYEARRADLWADLRVRAGEPRMEMMEAAVIGPPTFVDVNVHSWGARVVFVATSARRSSSSHRWIDEGRSRFVCLLARSESSWLLLSLRRQPLDGTG